MREIREVVLIDSDDSSGWIRAYRVQPPDEDAEVGSARPRCTF